MYVMEATDIHVNPFHSSLHLTKYFLVSKCHRETTISMDENHLCLVRHYILKSSNAWQRVEFYKYLSSKLMNIFYCSQLLISEFLELERGLEIIQSSSLWSPERN